MKKIIKKVGQKTLILISTSIRLASLSIINGIYILSVMLFVLLLRSKFSMFRLLLICSFLLNAACIPGVVISAVSLHITADLESEPITIIAKGTIVEVLDSQGSLITFMASLFR